MTNADCDDGSFCNGSEECRFFPEGTDIKVCMAPERGPCGEAACDEESRRCDCSDPDEDRDGFLVLGCAQGNDPPDCDDYDPTRAPNLKEVCNLSDPMHDEDCNDATYAGSEADGDHDNYLDSSCGNYLTFQPLAASAKSRLKNAGRDCDDHSNVTYPGAPEKCDRKDNNCDGTVDEAWGTPLEERKRYYVDLDGDGYGNEPFETSCNIVPPGYALLGGDCDDSTALVSPIQAEICNGYNDNCDDKTDEPLTPGTLMLDQPYDGGLTQFACMGEEGWRVERCPTGRLDCGENTYLDGCETIGDTLCNCRTCGNVCQFSCGEADCEEIRSVSAGLVHTCLLVQPESANGHGRIACMGYNAYGQLGLGTTEGVRVPTLVAGITDAVGIATGNRHSCAVGTNGLAYCWGANDHGQLGLGDSGSPVPRPQQIPSVLNQTAKSIAAGAFHTCAIYDQKAAVPANDVHGLVQCWGQGDSGQLGNDYYEDGDSPSPVLRLVGDDVYLLSSARQVVAGYYHSCALIQGRVECWGDNAAGQLGQDPQELPSAATAVALPGLEGVDEIAAAGVNTCARVGKNVYCWGGNVEHQLAHNDGLNGPPRLIPGVGQVAAMAVGPFFACALNEAEEIHCWGTNLHGERGTSDPEPGIAPTLIPLNGARRIFAANGGQVCAIKADGSAWCWGQNDGGQLGNGMTSGNPQPVASPILPLGSSKGCADTQPSITAQ